MRPHRDEVERQARQREKVATTLRGAKPVATRQLKPGTVAYAQVPFADGTGWKSRPAVIVSVRGREVVVRPITTRREWKPRTAVSVPLRDWEAAGLSRPSQVSPLSVALDRMAVTGIVGRLSDVDLTAVQNSTRPAAAGSA
jgi:hypothetical protein